MDRISRRSQGLEGIRFGDHRISSLIFADVVLLAPSSLDLQHALGNFAAEFEAAGMRVSTSKSEAMVLDQKKVACTFGESPKAVVTIKPDKHVFRGETVTLRCEIQGGGDTEWTYSWYKNDYELYREHKTQEFRLSLVRNEHSGNYTCRGWRSSDTQSSEISDAVTLTVSYVAETVVSVSPSSWLTEGDSVTLSCEVKHSSTDWTFSWYTDVPYRDSWGFIRCQSEGAGFKLFYYGVDSKRNGVGVVLKEEFVRNVLEVKRVSDRVMSLKLEIEGVMLNVVSGYAPQVGCELEEKERFWSELDEVMESIPTGERVVIGADFNGHVGEGNTGDEEVMGKFGV
ncbi:hypothetical protein QTP86_009259 [Hemibagrus guttatus]|nr:hypothetical protein QTP86_009259 [Hemibagrus guttatus]